MRERPRQCWGAGPEITVTAGSVCLCMPLSRLRSARYGPWGFVVYSWQTRVPRVLRVQSCEYPEHCLNH